MFERLLTRLGAALQRAGIPYMVIGGQAVLIHGEPRLTRDIDVTVGLGPEQVERVLAVVAELGLKPLPDDPAAFAALTMVVPAVEAETGIRVDLILSVTTYEAQAIERALTVPIGSGSVRVATAEDLVVHKIIAGRARDLEDVRFVLARNPDLDRSYVRGWLREFEAATDAEGADRPVDVFDRIAGPS